MLYLALFYGTSIQDDIYTQVTGDEIEAGEIEESDIILSGEEVPFDCYLDIDVAELESWLEPLTKDFGAAPVNTIQKASP